MLGGVEVELLLLAPWEIPEVEESADEDCEDVITWLPDCMPCCAVIAGDCGMNCSMGSADDTGVLGSVLGCRGFVVCLGRRRNLAEPKVKEFDHNWGGLMCGPYCTGISSSLDSASDSESRWSRMCRRLILVSGVSSSDERSRECERLERLSFLNWLKICWNCRHRSDQASLAASMIVSVIFDRILSTMLGSSFC